MNIICKSSIEITDDEWMEITDSFNANFPKGLNWQNFKKYFLNSYLGYAFHSLVLNNEGKIVGHTAFIPKKYQWNGTEILMAQSGSTFIDKEYRTDLLLYRKLYDALKKFVAEKGVQFILIVPNKAAYTYTERILKCKNIFALDYYIIPSTGIYSRWGRFLGMVLWPLKAIQAIVFSLILEVLHLWLRFKKMDNSANQRISLIRNEEFEKLRYYNERDYRIIQSGKLKYVLNSKIEKGIRTAYLMHFEFDGDSGFRAFKKTLKHLQLSTDAPELVMLIGNYEWMLGGIFKLPAKYQPQRFPLMIDSMSLSFDQVEFLLDRKNWKFSLENFDVR